MVFESRDGDTVNVAQVIGLYRPNVVAQTTNQGQTGEGCRKCSFHGAGEADASGEAETSGGGEAELGPVLGGAGNGSGAVVVSGASEAGGGSETSASGDGNGASLFAEPGFALDPLLACRAWFAAPFFFPASAVEKAG